MDTEVESRVQYLWEAAGALSGSSHVERLLKSHYLRSCITHDKSLISTNAQFSKQNICSNCAYPFIDGQFKAKVLSRNGAPSRKISKLISTYRTNADQMNRKQKIKAKLYLKKNTCIDLCCGLCGHHTKVPIDKPKKESKPDLVVEKNNLSTSCKKKKRKQTEFGKNISVPVKTKSLPPKNNASLKKIQQPKKKPPVISATKQNNQLLKLAEMLKKSNNSSSSNSLNKLLK